MVEKTQLIIEQLKLADKVITSDSVKKIKTIAGAEQAFIGEKVISAVVVCDYKDFKIIEKKDAIVDAKLNYISGFLFYREGPAVIEAFNRLEQKPDVLIVNANGILHPRRLGMASHLGILLDVPTIGVVKRLTMGELKENTIYVDKEARGYKISTRKHANPIYVSPGHKISLKTSKEIVKQCIKYPHKFPEPLHLARKHVNKIRKEAIKES